MSGSRAVRDELPPDGLSRLSRRDPAWLVGMLGAVVAPIGAVLFVTSYVSDGWSWSTYSGLGWTLLFTGNALAGLRPPAGRRRRWLAYTLMGAALVAMALSFATAPG